MSVSTPSFARLEWLEVARWAFSCRFSFKAWPPVILDFLQWLGPHIEPQSPYVPPGEAEPPTLVGTMSWDAERRPYLFWLTDGHLELENLNA